MKGKTLRLAIMFILVAAIVLFMFFSGESLALEDYVSDGRELPVGEYVSSEARWVIGPFATRTSASFFNTVKLGPSETGRFYYLLLEDGTLMVISTANDEERAAFDRISEKLMDAQTFLEDGETRKVNGKLRELTNEDLKKIYRDDIGQTFGISPDDPIVRYLILDTTAGREWVFYVGCALLFVTITAFLVIGLRKDNRKTVSME